MILFKESRKEADILSDKAKSEFLQVIRSIKRNGALTPLILAILIFNMLIVASVAWITINREAKVNEIGMGLAVDDTAATYKVYMFDLENMVGTNTHAGDDSELTLTNLDFNQYDTIFHSQNKYTPAIAKIQITRINSMPESGTVYLTLTRNDLEEEDGKLSMYSSSVIRFTAIIDHSKEDVSLTDPDNIYRHINNKYYTTVSGYKGNDYDFSKTFVTVNGEGAGHTHEKVESITLSIPYSSSDWYNDDGEKRVMNVYLYMTYNVHLIECFMNENTGGISLDDNVYLFKNDMNMITVSYEK